MLSTLQAGRAVAAILVVAFHANAFCSAAGAPLAEILWAGNAGVEFFFVLSGFLMTEVHWKDLGQKTDPRSFWGKRFRRIYPTYWIVLAGLSIASFALPNLSSGAPSWSEFLTSALLVPTGDFPVLTAAWTLQHEIAFYLVFGILLWNARVGAIVLSAWAAACLASVFFAPGNFPLSFLLSPYNALFTMGVAAGYIYRTRPPTRSLTIGLAGVVAFAVIAWMVTYLKLRDLDPPYRFAVLAYGLAASMAIVGFATAEIRGQVAPPKWLQLLGDASYCIYLINGPALLVLIKLAAGIGLVEGLTVYLIAIATCTATVAAGLSMHIFLERPLLKALSRWPQSRSEAPTAAPAKSHNVEAATTKQRHPEG